MHIATRLAGFSAADVVYPVPQKRPRPSKEDSAVVYARPESAHCAYCATPLFVRSEVTSIRGLLSDSWRSLDHVVPLAAGGANDASNLVAACSGCNRNKGEQPLAVFVASGYLVMRRKAVARRAARAARAVRTHAA